MRWKITPSGARGMSTEQPGSLVGHFSVIEDPRDEGKRRHLLIDAIVICIAAVLCGADGWTEIEEFGKAKEGWFRRFLKLPFGIPSHDTLGRIFSVLSPEVFEARFREWVASVRAVYGEDVIAIDGKSLRRSHNRKQGLGPLHMVSAWSTANGLVLAQQATEAKSNEITAIPKVLQMLELKGCIVTLDAMGCQKAIAEQIVERGGEYVLALKGNQSTLAEAVEELFTDADAADYAGWPMDFYETTERGHGRVETRRYWTLTAVEKIAQAGEWQHLNTVGMVQSERQIDGKTTRETRFYIASTGGDARRFAWAVRNHWGIENGLHWCLDIAFREDESRIRNRQAATNLAVMRHITLGLLKKDATIKRGIKTKRLVAGWDEDYLAKLLFEQSN
jgi:predicted transposase YbfD/YdcC